MTVVVRRATVDDAALIASLNADVQAIHVAAMPAHFKPASAGAFSRSEIVDLLTDRQNLVFIADIEGEPVGYAYAQIIRRPETSLVYAHDMIYIHHISVRPARHRRGVGSALIAALRAAGQDLGIGRLALDVWVFNDAARAFFRRQGFTRQHERFASTAVATPKQPQAPPVDN
jgi:ribosomal protein S18 acetylase RimI-like enzyme